MNKSMTLIMIETMTMINIFKWSPKTTVQILQGAVLHYNYNVLSCSCLKSCEKQKIWKLCHSWNSGSVETIIWLASFFLRTRGGSFTRISEIWNSQKCKIKFGGIIYYQPGFSDKAPAFHLSAIYPQKRDHNKLTEDSPIDLFHEANCTPYHQRLEFMKNKKKRSI